jgi:hypothetical protein
MIEEEPMRLFVLLVTVIGLTASPASAADVEGKEGLWLYLGSSENMVSMYFSAGKSRQECSGQARAFSKDNEGHVVNGKKLGKLMLVVPERDDNWSKGCVASYRLEASK